MGGASDDRGGGGGVSKVKGIFYVAAAGGFLYWARRSHLLRQYRHVREMPQSCLDTHLRLRGTVAAVLPDATLRVQHEPLIPIEHWLNTSVRPDASPACINVKLAALNVAEVGRQHLQQHVVGDRIWFEPMRRQGDTVDANITAKQPGTRRPVLYNLNRDLIQRGYARVKDGSDAQHLQAVRAVPAYSRLVNQMQIAQRGAGSTVGNEMGESLLTWPLHIGQVVQNSSLYQIGVLAATALYVALIRSVRLLRVLAGRERNAVPINHPSDALQFIRVYVFGAPPAGYRGPPDPKIGRSYNFPTKLGPDARELLLRAGRSAARLLASAIRQTVVLMGVAVRAGVRASRRGLSTVQASVKQAQKQAAKKTK